MIAAAAYVVVALFVTVDLVTADRRDPGGRRRRHREALAAAVMAVGALIVGVLYTALFSALWGFVGQWAPDGMRSFWSANPLLAALAAFVAWDLSGWLYHLLGHRTQLGWAGHRSHHTGSSYNGSLALRLSWTPFIGLLHHPLLALLGFGFPVIVTCAAVSNLCQALQHSSAPDRTPHWLRSVVITPEAHRHHHLTGSRVNLGPVLTVWDRMAGTRCTGPVPVHALYGDDVLSDTRPLRAETAGWLALCRRVPSWHPRRTSPVVRSNCATSTSTRSSTPAGWW